MNDNVRLSDGTIRRKRSKNVRIVKWIIEILDGDILSTNEILEGMRDIKLDHNGYPPKYLPTANKLVSILYANPEFTRVNGKHERPALWGMK
tara:strand:+ start:2455 stop:2730 length:276 start_codon:yes stop_codon:yes gene_type:complete